MLSRCCPEWEWIAKLGRYVDDVRVVISLQENNHVHSHTLAVSSNNVCMCMVTMLTLIYQQIGLNLTSKANNLSRLLGNVGMC